MNMTTLNIDDMHCASCTGKIQVALDHLEGVLRLQFNPARRQLVVSHTSSMAAHELIAHIERIGFHPYLSGSDGLSVTDCQDGAGGNSGNRADDLLKRLGVAGLAMMQVMMVAVALYSGVDEYRRVLEFTSLIFCIPVVSYSAMPFFVAALRSATGGLGMDVPIALAIIIAFTSSVVATLSGSGDVYYDSVVMFTFLLLAARYIDLKLKYRVDAQDALMSSLPRQVIRIIAGERDTCDLKELRAGDTIWVGEGAQIPADGILLSGPAYIDEALLTGEDIQTVRSGDDTVYAGTYNRGAGVSIRVIAVSDKTRMAAINRMAGEAQISKNAVAQLADRIAGIFIPSVLLLSIVTYLGWKIYDPTQAFSASLAVLVISCPCALSLAIPAALSAAMLRLRQAGVLLKDGKFLELIPAVTDLFMDKTGTLTQPKPGVSGIKVFGEFDAQWCLSVAGALQSYSSHPLAGCFASSRLQLDAVKSVPGSGLEAIFAGKPIRIGSAGFCGFGARAETSTEIAEKNVYLAVGGEPAACFFIDNPLRKNAQEAVKLLTAYGLDVHIVSGDKQDNCETVARALDVKFDAEQSPEDKWKLIEHSKGDHRIIMFVGDGINDLPSLAGADVSVAMLEASDLVKSRADVVLLTTRLGALADLFNIARRTRSITRQNLLWALLYNLLAIPAAAFAFAPPWLAALGMALSSTLVMLNATRLIRIPHSFLNGRLKIRPATGESY